MSERELEALQAALRAIEEGASGDSQESEFLEFKEDPAVHSRGGNPDAKLTEILADETVCFSNSDAGVAYIVVGVSDRKSGREAFTGTDRQPEWFEKKIFDNTRPNIAVEAREMMWADARLVALRVPRGLTLYQRPRGQAGKRMGSDCVPLSEEQRRDIAFRRANPDFSAYPSIRPLSEIDPVAIDQARQLLASKRAIMGNTLPAPNTTEELLLELALLTVDGKLTFAGEILFMPPQRGRVTMQHQLRTVPGGEPKITRISAPLVTAFLRLGPLIQTNASSEVANIQLGNGQEVAVPAFPERAVDEVVANAAAHRDWDAVSPIVVEQSPTELKVWSPGGLPVGVTVENLLTTQSIPRNPTLMSALRMLGLAEQASRGFDRMWVSMLSTGRTPPSVQASANFVEVSLSSGRVDKEFVVALARLREVYGAELFESVNGLIIARHLMDNPILTTSTAAQLMQVSFDQASGVLGFYANARFLEQLRDAPEWVLSGQAREAMRIGEDRVVTTVTIQEWVETQLREGKSLSSREVAEELGVDRRDVTRIFTHLRDIGRAKIDPKGASRGPTVRWIRT